ncbi:ABC transporter substrate-binding protein [Carboxydothermus pertinax]|uniref:Ethanolamine utilization protein EutJ n=1 Tax=Carboxydothermus pertinax TaxID=870242 RepID=A0A1L8CYX1_9THEO|nr:ABC transporter substrate-binding protein [Carboxydothermus pertinax]GAV24064.1 ethanolamine utilization protein EutJ [Carboxydothermus pertinax]
MKRKGFTTLLLVSLLAFLLVFTSACGTKSTEEKKSGDVIKIGVNLELSGNVASFGQSALNGFTLALDEINAAGGINGKKLEIIKYDNKSDNTEAASVATRLITQDKVPIIFGAVTSGNTMAFINIAETNKVPVLTATATNPDVTVDPKTGKVREYVFRTCFIDPFQGTAMAKFATEELKVKRAAILKDNTSPYSVGLAKFFTEGFKAGGGEVVADENFTVNDQDFRSVLTKIKSLNPDFIYVPAYYEQVGQIVKQAREMGINVAFGGSDGWDSPKLIEIAGKDALKNCYITNHYSPDRDNPKVKEFVKKYKEKYGNVPDALAALGYDTGYVLAAALKNAKEITPEAIKDALKNVKDVEGVTGKISIDEQHNAKKGLVILEFVDGKQTYKKFIEP